MKIDGRAKTNKPRVLECLRDGDELYFWIHSPESKDNGWEIWVPAEVIRDTVWSSVWQGRNSTQKHNC